MPREKEITLEELLGLMDKAGISLGRLRGLAAACEQGGCAQSCPSGCQLSCSTCAEGKSTGSLSVDMLQTPLLEQLILTLKDFASRIPAGVGK